MSIKLLSKFNSIYYLLPSLIIIGILGYSFGHKEGISIGYKNGYSQGQVKLALDITRELNITVNNSTKEKYVLFQNIQDITLYIYEKNNIKTIAKWK